MTAAAQYSVLLAFLLAGCASEENFLPPAGYVPDAKTAAAIAEAVWKPIYGTREIDEQKPFEVQLVGNTWHVSGTLKQPKEKGLVMIGGTAEVEIDKTSGKIVRLIHSE